jgi:hypothetical protein
LVIAALLFRGCLAIREGRSFLGGVLLGIAAGCKCTPLLFAPYLVWRGRWLACLTMLFTAVGVNLLPDLVDQSPHGHTWLEAWWKTYIAPQVGGDALPGVWASEVIYNQSLAGALNRWTQTIWHWEPMGIVVSPTTNALSPVDLKHLVRTMQLAIAALAFLLFLHRPFRPIVEVTREAADNRHALECSIVLILMLLFSPMSSKPHFCTLLLAGFYLARAVIRAERRAALTCVMGMAILCGLLANKDLVKARIYTLVLWYGLVTVSAALLGIGSGLTLLQNRKERTETALRGQPLDRAAA